jgi:hypothetical protein
MPFAKAKLRSQSRNAAVVDNALRNEVHRPRRNITPCVPSRPSGNRIRPAALTRPKARMPSAQRRREEADILRPRRPRRTARATKDSGRKHSREEPSVKARIACLYGAAAILELRIHASIVAPRSQEVAHKSDFVIDSRAEPPSHKRSPPMPTTPLRCRARHLTRADDVPRIARDPVTQIGRRRRRQEVQLEACWPSFSQQGVLGVPPPVHLPSSPSDARLQPAGRSVMPQAPRLARRARSQACPRTPRMPCRSRPARRTECSQSRPR